MSGTGEDPAERLVASARASIGAQDYRVAIRAGRHELTADERPARGGGDAGPSPYEHLLSGLGACTAITLRMYAGRKGWDLRGVEVSMRFVEDGRAQRIDRAIALEGDLSEEQRSRLADIAERTPVTLTLKNGVAIATTLRPAG
jgi:putative redox protein